MRSRTRGSRRADRRWGQYQTFRTTLRRPVHRYETANGLTSNDESVLIPLSARSDGLDDGDGSPERCVYIQMGGIEQVRIGGGLEGGRLALRIPLVAPQKVDQDLLPVGLHAAGLQFGDTTRGTHLRGGGDVELHVGRGGDNGPDVAAVQHRARLPCRESALIVQECRAHLRYGRHDRRGRGHGLCLQCIFVEFFRIERGSRGRGVDRIVGRMAGIEHRLGDGPVEQSRIQVMQAVMRGHPARQRALARRGRAVDGDDQDTSAPTDLISSTNPGKLVAINAPSSILTGRSLAMPWSMWVVTRPPPGARPLPCTIKSSPSISTSTPFTRRSAAVAARRSDSLTRNSLRPRITVVPSAKAAATARIGYSSIMDGARAAGTSTPRSPDARTRISAVSSPPSVRRSRCAIDAPISASVIRSPVRSGLSITPSRITSEPGVSSAAISGKAAEDGSAGTTIGAGANSGWPVSVIRRPFAPSSSTRTAAPKWLSIFSVWSRVASRSTTTVSPGAERPASNTADLSCADATGGSNTIGIGSRAPASVNGSRPSADASVRAPMRSSGSSTRRIGRVRNEASPSNAAVTGQPATAPSIRRQPVPELPKSSGAAGSAKPPTP